jgi:hypothetical protein
MIAAGDCEARTEKVGMSIFLLQRVNRAQKLPHHPVPQLEQLDGSKYRQD